MIDDLTVSRHETGVTRVFALDLPENRLAALRNGDGASLKAALGVEIPDRKSVEVVRVSDLEPIGLAGYLSEGFGVPEDAIKPSRDDVDAVTGEVMIVASPAFGGGDAMLRPAEGVALIATYREPATAPSFEPIRSDGAAGTIAPPDLASASMSGHTLRAGWILALGIVLACLVLYLVT